MSDPVEKPDGNAPGGNDDTPVGPPGGTETLSSITTETLAESHVEPHAGFDPAIHAVNDDGSPKMKASGGFALKRGRKAGTAAAIALPPKNAAAQAVVGEAVKTLSLDQASRESANLVINVAVWTLGEEVGKPIDKAEADGLRLSFRNYYEARGVPNLPPELGLFVALGSYIGPRIMHEKSKTKMEKAAAWLSQKLKG